MELKISPFPPIHETWNILNKLSKEIILLKKEKDNLGDPLYLNSINVDRLQHIEDSLNEKGNDFLILMNYFSLLN